MDNKDRLAELIAGMTEAQTAPLLSIAQNYLNAMREAEEKGRTDVSSEVIQYLNKAAPRDAAAAREAAPRDAAGRSSSAWSAYQQNTPQPAYAPAQGNTPPAK